MGASRKLQGEIDRVLKKVQEGVDVFDSIWNKVYDTDNANQKEKFEADLKKEIKKLQRYRDQIKTWIQSSEIKDKKVSASYEQALVDARKLIEREMERFKICEKETKTKAFSKEGLGQQPKTDPKEKAKSETRDWINNVVSELETQIDIFEAEIEGLSVKKGKTRPPRLIHLETSITRHKAHIMKLELLLRLLDNDELSPEQVNDAKDFLDDYVERNQEDFEDFSDVDELYSSLPLDKVESLEELVTMGPSSLLKATPLSLKSSLTATAAQTMATSTATHQQSASVQEQAEETGSQDANSDIIIGTPPAKGSVIGSAASTPTGVLVTSILSNAPALNTSGAPTTSAALPGPASVHAILENAGASNSSSTGNLSNLSKEEENVNLPGRKPSPSLPDVFIARGLGRLAPSSQSPAGAPLTSIGALANNGVLSSVPSGSDIAKRNTLGADDRLGSGGTAQPLVSPLSNRMILPQAVKAADGTGLVDSSISSDSAAIGGRVFSPPVVSGVQWRPGSSFNQNEAGQLRGRAEIAPDQREKFLQRLQQVQQQGHSTLLGMQSLAGGKQFSAAQQNPLLQQFNSQSSSGLGLGLQAPGLNTGSANSLSIVQGKAATMNSKALTFIVVAAFLVWIPTTSAFNITRLLSQYPNFSTFNDYLTQTHLAEQINRRQTITILAIDNSAIGGISGRSLDVLKRILSTHVILDYYDQLKLSDLSKKSTLLTTLYQTTGVAASQQGFLNVTKKSTGDIVFGSAVKGSPLNSTLVQQVATRPYNISVLQVSLPIIALGLDGAIVNTTTTPPPSPAATPKKAPAEAPAAEAPAVEAPTEEATSPESSDAPADAPVADGPAGSPSSSIPADAKTPSKSSSTRATSIVSLLMVVGYLILI